MLPGSLGTSWLRCRLWPPAKASGGQVTAGGSSRCAALAATAAVAGNPAQPYFDLLCTRLFWCSLGVCLQRADVGSLAVRCNSRVVCFPATPNTFRVWRVCCGSCLCAGWYCRASALCCPCGATASTSSPSHWRSRQRWSHTSCRQVSATAASPARLSGRVRHSMLAATARLAPALGQLQQHT